MTQPAPPSSSNTGTVIASAALGLALIAVEARVREEVEQVVATLYRGLAAAGLFTAAIIPASGLVIVSTAMFANAVRQLFTSARIKVRDAVLSGYQAAAELAYTKTRTELGTLNLPDALPELGGTDTVLSADVDTMFGHAQTRLDRLIIDRYNPEHPAAIAADIQDADRDLHNRAQQAAATAVHSGANDALQALFNAYQSATGIPGLMKRWRTTASDPCGMCAALDGSLVGINAEFDHQATTNDRDFRRVWRNLYGPPRHPNCRCQLELVVT